MRKIALAAAATLAFLGTSADADPLGLVSVSLSGPSTTTCASPTLLVSGRVQIAETLPGARMAVTIRVDGSGASFAGADDEGNYTAEVTSLSEGQHTIDAVVSMSTPLETASAPLTVTSTGAEYWLDGDGDGFGVGEPVCVDQHPGPGYAPDGGDCNDQDGTISPGADEQFEDEVDSNCNGNIDD